MPLTIEDILKDDIKFTAVAKLAFDSVDLDKNGQIDIKELETIMSKMSNNISAESPSQHDVLEVFKYLDEDKSGKVSFDEFKKLIREILLAVDQEE